MIGMISIHERPADVLGREFPGDWEGDLIKGAGNASAIGTLIERKSRFTILVKMKDCSSRAALIGFRRELGKVPAAMRTSLAYDQGKEMARPGMTAVRSVRNTALVDRTKTRQFTGQGCKKKACNSARQTAIAQLRGDVDRTCDNFVRADSTCVKNGC